jgi:hypothetical protein
VRASVSGDPALQSFNEIPSVYSHCPAKGQEFNNVNPAFSALALTDESLGLTDALRNLFLSQPGTLPCQSQLLQEDSIRSGKHGLRHRYSQPNREDSWHRNVLPPNACRRCCASARRSYLNCIRRRLKTRGLLRSIRPGNTGGFSDDSCPARFARLRIQADEARARHEELQEQERLSKLNTLIDLSDSARHAFSRLSDTFVAMTRSERIWDTVARVPTDRVRERTTAGHSINRQQVAFELGTCDLIQSEWRVPRLVNANGGDLFIYPGFLLFHISEDAFALVATSEVDITFVATPFIEEETVPADTRILRQVWKKANKDGSLIDDSVTTIKFLSLSTAA